LNEWPQIYAATANYADFARIRQTATRFQPNSNCRGRARTRVRLVRGIYLGSKGDDLSRSTAAMFYEFRALTPIAARDE